MKFLGKKLKKKPYLIGIGVGIILLTLCVIRFVSVNADSGNSDQVKLHARSVVHNQVATIKVSASSKAGIHKLLYKKGKITSTGQSKWSEAHDILDTKKFTTSKSGNYSILAEDANGEQEIQCISVEMEMKAVWIFFDEMNKKAKSYATWKAYIDKTFDVCKKKKFNTIIFQVRPFADAMYESSYYPWSAYATGTAGKNPGFDPFAYAVKAAHQRGLSIQAWVNPYRISKTTKLSSLASNSIALKWVKSSDAKLRRNVLKVGGALYFNPASEQVRTLVANGVKEIVKKYDVDGIHMDDYFYPSLGTKKFKSFDYKEYKAYKKTCVEKSQTPKTLVQWRRENVDKMVKKVYAIVKKEDKNCLFGISPAGNLKNLYSSTSYYSDVKKWMGSTEYIDYICPQIYWSFKHPVAGYKKMVKEWLAIKRSSQVNLYIGLAGYRAGISKKEAKSIGDKEWASSSTVLKRQVEYGRQTKKIDGYFLFSYRSLTSKKAKKEINNLAKVLPKR